MRGKHAAVNPATLGHDHVAVQFRDGKEPHCKVCGLTADGQAPQRRPFGGPSSPAAEVSVRPGPVPSVDVASDMIRRFACTPLGGVR